MDKVEALRKIQALRDRASRDYKQRRELAKILREAGCSYAEIGKALGVTRQAAHKMLNREGGEQT